MKYNIIGDIHGRTSWKKLIREDCINVFVGDYFDPYDRIPFEDLRDNFLEIVEYAARNTDTILLLGNHDLQYIHGEHYSRYNSTHAEEIKQLLMSNYIYLDIAASLENKVLVTHAGVSKEWLEHSGYEGEKNPDKVCEWLQSLFWDGFTKTSEGEYYFDEPRYRGMCEFTFDRCGDYWDMYGTTPTQSPVWIRPQTLTLHNGLPSYVQVVGHTQVNHIEEIPYPIWLVDCLGFNTQSLIINIDNEITYEVNEPQYK